MQSELQWLIRFCSGGNNMDRWRHGVIRITITIVMHEGLWMRSCGWNVCICLYSLTRIHFKLILIMRYSWGRSICFRWVNCRFSSTWSSGFMVICNFFLSFGSVTFCLWSGITISTTARFIKWMCRWSATTVFTINTQWSVTRTKYVLCKL